MFRKLSTNTCVWTYLLAWVASALGFLLFRRFVVWQVQYFVTMSSWTFTIWNYWGSGVFLRAHNFLVVICTCICPPPIFQIHIIVMMPLLGAYYQYPTRIFNYMLTSAWRSHSRFSDSIPGWCVLGIPRPLGLISCVWGKPCWIISRDHCWIFCRGVFHDISGLPPNSAWVHCADFCALIVAFLLVKNL